MNKTKFLNSIRKDEAKKYSLNILLGEFYDEEKRPKRPLVGKLTPPYYKKISPIVLTKDHGK